MENEWGREDQSDLAVEKILEAADKAFTEIGVSAAGMGEIASYAGCSRGTLYRYFKNRHELHVAYAKRTALVIQRRAHDAVAKFEDPEERLVEYVLRAVAEVRNDPAAAAWFAPNVSRIESRMSRSSEVAEVLTGAFAADVPASQVAGQPELRLTHRWIVRVIVSLLSDPGEDAAEERAIVERFVVPSIMST
ncbi:MAG: TetR/AcrR family transcriptional regulator [Myxococcota bacterium]